MSTTTIRLTDTLKSRLAEAAERAGTTSHSFILEAIAEKVDAAERHNGFLAEAEARYTEIVATGKTIAWSEMQRYLEARLAGENIKPPSPKKFRR